MEASPAGSRGSRVTRNDNGVDVTAGPINVSPNGTGATDPGSNAVRALTAELATPTPTIDDPNTPMRSSAALDSIRVVVERDALLVWSSWCASCIEQPSESVSVTPSTESGPMARTNAGVNVRPRGIYTDRAQKTNAPNGNDARFYVARRAESECVGDSWAQCVGRHNSYCLTVVTVTLLAVEFVTILMVTANCSRFRTNTLTALARLRANFALSCA